MGVIIDRTWRIRLKRPCAVAMRPFCHITFITLFIKSLSFKSVFWLPSVLWHCWLGIRKSIQPVKHWVARCWHGYLSRVRCRWFQYGPADATATLLSAVALKSRMVFRWSFAICYRIVVLSVCNVGVLWPNDWMDQDATWYKDRPQPRWRC